MKYNSRLLAVLWIMIVSGMALLALYRADADTVIDGDMLSLLPEVQRDESVDAVVDKLAQKFDRQVVFLVSHESDQVAISVLEALDKKIENDVSTSIDYGNQSDKGFESLAALYYQHLSGLMSQSDAQLLEKQQYDVLVNKSLSELYSPVGMVSSEILKTDPFFFFSRYLNQSSQSNNVSWKKGWPFVDHNNKRYFLYNANLKFSAFNLQQQTAFVDSVDKWKKDTLLRYPAVKILHTGTIFYANDGAVRAKQEVSTVGVGSLIGVVLLLLLSFKVFKVLPITALSIGISIVVAASAVVIVYTHIHLIALIFGATLIGITIDYSFHYFAEFYSNDGASGVDVKKRINVALLFGLCSSVIAYSSLLWGDFPGLQQIAIFSVVGLVSAYLNVVLIYPIVFARGSEKKLNGDAVERWSRRIFIGGKSIAPVVVVLIGVSVVGIPKLTANDDIRLLQPISVNLKAQQKELTGILSNPVTTSYFLVRAANVESLLVKQEYIKNHVREMEGGAAVTGSLMLANYLPSAASQKRNVQMKRDFYSTSEAYGYFDSLGLDGKNAKIDFTPITLDKLEKTALKNQLDDLLYYQNSEFYGVVYFPKFTNAAQVDLTDRHIYWIDKAGDISKAFKVFRVKAIQLLLAGVCLISIIFAARYGLVAGLKLASVPIGACVATLGILGLLTVSFNLFHLLGMMVVLGLGLDYAIFMKEREDSQGTTLVAVTLSAITTLLAFGLLSISATPAVSSFGLSVLVGVLLTFTLSVLLIQNKRAI